MTCIVGLEHDGTVYMGGDSAAVAMETLGISSVEIEKVFLNHKFVIGYSTSFRMGQLLQYHFRPPKHPSNQQDIEYLITLFVDSVKKCFSDNGLLKTSEEVESGSGSFLVGYNGKLYEIDSAFQVTKTTDSYNAIGCGASIALGSLYSTVTQPPEKRILCALQAAHQFSAGVRPPFVVKKL